jgi:hypothetical protein
MKEPKIERLRIAYDNLWDIVWITGFNVTYLIYATKDDTKPKIIIL